MVDTPEDDDIEDDDLEREEDETQDAPGTSDVEQRTIREVLAQAYEEERRAEAERVERGRQLQQEQDARVEAYRKKRHAEAQAERRVRRRALNLALSQVQREVAASAKSLKAALQAAGAVRVPRFSEEGLALHRLVRAIEDTMVSLRRVGRVATNSASSTDELLAPDLPVETEAVS